MTTPDQPAPREGGVGRDLDALVAERVMGWTLAKSVSPGPPVWETHPERQAVSPSTDEWAVPLRGHFTPSIDIADAWAVVGKLRADGWRFRLTEDVLDGTWEAEFARDAVYRWSRSREAPSAICRAALAAAPGDGRGREEERHA